MDLSFDIKANYAPLEEAEAELAKFSAEYQRLCQLMTKVDMTSGQFASLPGQISAAYDKMQTAQDKVVALAKQVNSYGGGMEGVMRSLNEAFKQSAAELQGYSDKMEPLFQKLTELEAKRGKASSENVQSDPIAQQKHDEKMSGYDTSIASTTAEMDKLSAAMDECEARMATYSQQMASVAMQMAQMGTASDQTAARTQALKDSIQDTLQSVGATREAVTGLQSLYSEQIGDATTKTEGIKTMVADLNQGFQDAQASIDATSQKTEEAIDKAASAQDAFLATQQNRGFSNDSPEAQQNIADARAAIEDYGRAVSEAYANAQVAFTEQANLVSALEAKLQELKTAQEQAAASGDTERVAALQEGISALQGTLDTAKEKLGELSTQLEGTRGAFENVGQAQAQMEQYLERDISVLGRLKDGLSNAGASMKDFAKSVWDWQKEKANDAMDAFSGAIDGMGIPLSKSIKGIKSMTMASLKFLATPLGLALGAIVLALKAFKTWTTKSVAGQKVMTKISAYLGSVMQTVTDVLVILGDYLYAVFSENIKPLKEYFNTMVKVAGDAFSIVYNLLSGLGKAIINIFTGDWDKVTEGLGDMWKGIKSVGDLATHTVDMFKSGMQAAVGMWRSAIDTKNTTKLADQLKSTITSVGDAAKMSADLAAEEQEATIGLNKEKAKTLSLQAEIAAKQNEMYKLQGKDKQAAINELKELKAHMLDGQIKQAQKLADIRKKRNSRDQLTQAADSTNDRALAASIRQEAGKYHVTTLADIAAARDAQNAVYRLQAQQQAGLRMLSRQEGSLQRSMESKAKSAANKDKSQTNAVTSAKSGLADVLIQNEAEMAASAYALQKKIEKARIDAMEDGVEKREALRRFENENELTEIENAAKAAVAAERERQKKEFEAQQKVIKAQGGTIKAWDDSMLDNDAIQKIEKQYETLAFYMQMGDASQLYSKYKGGNKQADDRKKQIAQLKVDIDQLEALLAKYTEEGDTEQAESARLAAEEARRQMEWLKGAKEKWNEYYKEYGTFLEKRNALQSQFDFETAGMSKTSPEYAAALKKFQADISQIELESIKKQMNWEEIFGDLSSVSKTALQQLEQQIENLIKHDKNLSVEAIKDLSEALDKVRKEQTARGGLLSAFTSMRDARKARRAMRRTQKNVEGADDGKLWSQYNSANSEAERANIRNMSVKDPTNGELTTFGNLLDKASAALKDFTKAQKDAQNAIKNAGSQLSQLGQLGNSVGDLLGSLGVDMPEGFGTAFSGIGEMGQALESFDVTKPGSLLNLSNYANFAKGMVGVFTGIADGFAELFGKNKSLEAYEDAAKNLEKMSSLWDTLIAKKKEYAELSFGDSRTELYQDALTAAEAELKAVQNTALKYNRSHKWNDHTKSYKSDRAIGKATFAEMSAAIGKNIGGVSDLLTLTNEELTKLMEIGGGEWWTKLDDTQRDYLQQIMSMNDEIDELNDSIASTAQGITFDDMVSKFGDAMKDMSNTAEDFVDEMNDYMRNAVIEDALSGAEDELKRVYEKYNQLAEQQGGKLTEAQVAQREQELRAIGEYYVNQRDQAVKNYGLNESTAETQQKNAYATASESSIEELSGRMLANNEALYMIRALNSVTMENTNTINATLQSISLSVAASLDIQDNSYLELQAINANTAQTAKRYLPWRLTSPRFGRRWMWYRCITTRPSNLNG